jgi:predicted nucleic acid-binding protein
LSYLLDTNVISEFRHETPDPNVWAWMAKAPDERVFISVVTITDLRRRSTRLPAGRRRRGLEEWVAQNVRDRFDGRILGVDVVTAEMCGHMPGTHHLDLRIRRIMDFWLAAIAMQHELTLVTRNVKDFQGLGVRLIDP